MDQIFHPSKHKFGKFILLKHAYTTSLKSSKYAKMSANVMTSMTTISHKFTHCQYCQLDKLKGAKAPVIPFKNKNNNFGQLKNLFLVKLIN